MASSFVKQYIKPGEPTRITLPSTKLMWLLNLDGKTRLVTVPPSAESAHIQGMGYSILPSDCGLHQDSTGQWFGYLSEDQL